MLFAYDHEDNRIYIDDTHRMDIRYKDGSFNSAEYCYYVNMAEKKVAYTKGTNSWNIK